MKTVFLAREGIAARHIASVLEKTQPISIIFEKGGPARKRKLKRYFSSVPFYLWPLSVLDIASAVIYGRQMAKAFAKAFPEPALKSEALYCDDANDSDCARLLQTLKPDLVLVYGTALLNKKTLGLAPLFLNLHGGIVPHYRNVHSEFWALANAEPGRIGTSVLYMSPGVDSGDVALQESIPSADGSSVIRAAIANTNKAAELGSRALKLAAAGQLPRSRQNANEARSFATPGFTTLMRAWFTGRPKV